ncbi:LuxR C-terminal-related transcriptional regulator [Sneathiella chinensis]|uniref:DNA-binding response regulator n=1 Tax=Sneathiella chinensis TaxID=349750 RepID=A0ABQ5U6G3_9PROT|nr:response regulator transcription factor [Sneathiella chinensis]GLQ07273.1 DNA-binding response regulator [Sneathiella chinensis]
MRVLVIDQIEICRSGFKLLLQEAYTDSLVFGAETVEQGLTFMDEVAFDLVLVDIDDISKDDMEARARLRELAETIPVIGVSLNTSQQCLYLAFELKFSGFIEKQSRKEIVIAAINMVRAGGQYYPPHLHPEYLRLYGDTPETEDFGAGTGWSPRLTGRQLDVLKALAKGKSNKAIARELNIAPGTVKAHMASLMRDLKAKNRTQAVNIANHLNLI